ncbi:MAG: hypothetical protein AB7V13_10785 [Pseudorhodoplanes sp.]|uniref:hypothetical protein n=1 Tax=Pseudorhodoplanes sp. TaxID=1934341 RepID=UPI003D12EC53
MLDQGAREVGRVYAARGPWIDDVTPGDPADDAHFESRPIPEDAWSAFEGSALCERLHGLPHDGIIGSYEEFSFRPEQLAAFVALIETEGPRAPAPARGWLAEMVRFSRRAQERGVGVTFIVSG